MLRELDAVIGQQVERLVVSHHRRRLNRIGYGDVLSAPPGGWASSAPPPRPGSLLDVHVDGAEALPASSSTADGRRLSRVPRSS